MAPPRTTSSNAKLKKKIGPEPSSKRRKNCGWDRNEFVSEEAAAKHEGDIVYRSIVDGKPVPKHFIQSSIPMLYEKLNRLGWLDFLAIYTHTYPVLVQLFYANLSVDLDKYCINSKVRGSDIILSFSDIAKLLQLPRGKFYIFESKIWPKHESFDVMAALKLICAHDNFSEPFRPKASQLNFESRLMHHFITYNIIPRAGSRDDVSYMDVFLLWAVHTGFPIDIPYIIARNMILIMNKSSSALPYCALITLALQSVGVQLEKEKSKSPHESYCGTSLLRMGYEMHGDKWVKKGVTEYASTRPSTSVSGSTAKPIPSEEEPPTELKDMLSLLLKRIESIDTNVREVRSDVKQIKQHLHIIDDPSEEQAMDANEEDDE